MEKELITSGKMTFKFIWHFILYSIVINIITNVMYSLIFNKVNNVIITSIISTTLSCVTIFIATKLSIKDIFTERKLDEENFKKYRRNIIIFFVICIIVNIFYYALSYSVSVSLIDKYVSNLQIAGNKDISGVIQKAKDIQLVMVCIVTVIKSFVYIAMVKYQDRYIK